MSRVLPLLLVLPLLIFAQYQRPSRTVPKTVPKSEAMPPVIMRGTLRSLNKKEIVIDEGEDRTVTFRRLKKTRFLKGLKEISETELRTGAAVAVEANRERNGDFDAINVFLGEPPGSLR